MEIWIPAKYPQYFPEMLLAQCSSEKSEMHWKLQKTNKQTTTMTKKNEKDMST